MIRHFNFKCLVSALILALTGFGYQVNAQNYTAQFSLSFAQVSGGALKFIDIDNDGDKDLFIAGLSGTTSYFFGYYRNDGGTLSTQVTPNLTGFYDGSIDFGDYNNDGYIDILCAGYTGSTTYLARVYRNNGNNTFTNLGLSNLVGLRYCSVKWSDLNNDGFLDIIMAGANNTTSSVTKVFYNNKNETFQEYNRTILPGVNYCSITCADYDSDGYTDFVISGLNYTKLFKNIEGQYFIPQDSINLPALSTSSISFGDFNQDHKPDLLLTGQSGTTSYCGLFINNGSGNFSQSNNTGISPIKSGCAFNSDFNNDGLLDVFVSGDSNGVKITRIFLNNGDQTFSRLSGTPFNVVCTASGQADAADINGDKISDIAICGNVGSTKTTKLYTASSVPSNKIPGIPQNPTSIVAMNSATLSWNPAYDTSSSPENLMYNVYISTIPGFTNQASPHSNLNNGYYRIGKPGNSGTRNSYFANNLLPGKYYWGVQTIDYCYEGGLFTPLDSFEITSIPIQASMITCNNISCDYTKIKWTRGSGDSCIVFMTDTLEYNYTMPFDSVNYNPDTVLGMGSLLGSWHCVYKGTADSAIISGVCNKGFWIRVYEFYSENGIPVYNRSIASANPKSNENYYFTPLVNLNLTGLYESSSDWGDYNNDGYLDLIIAGKNASGTRFCNLYKNEGNSTFTLQTSQPFTGVSFSNTDWGDYNNDGYIDLLLSGEISSGQITKVYTNNSGTSFTELTSITVTGLSRGSARWGDMNNDGLQDILMTGYTGSAGMVKIYKNNGNNTFSPLNINFPAITWSAAEWCDYNNDGYLDLIINSGVGVYKNNGDETFTFIDNLGLPSWTNRGFIDWGDYDNDGYIDLLSTGGQQTAIYKNINGNSFVKQTQLNLTSAAVSAAAWGDYNNDGFLDIILTGKNLNSKKFIASYTNNGDGTFTQIPVIGGQGLFSGDIRWADFNNDQRLDLILTGSADSVAQCIIYKNNFPVINKTPLSPLSLSIDTIFGNSAILSWRPATDTNTISKGLSYNICVTSDTNHCNFVSPLANLQTGQRMVAQTGNAFADTMAILKNVPSGTLYWKVQTIDHSYKASPFSTWQTFQILTPSVQAHDIQVQTLPSTEARLSWSRGDGDKCVVFIKKGNQGVAHPVFNFQYLADTNFSLGSQIDTSGWFAVYNGIDSSCIVANLNPGNEYRVMVCEYFGAPSEENYLTLTSTGNPVNFITQLFSENTVQLPGLKNGTLGVFDYNNDNLLDFVITGDSTGGPITRIFKNNGDGTYSGQYQFSITGVRYSSISCADFDNDGFVDFVLTGNSGTARISKVYKNNNGTSFSEVSTIVLPAIDYGCTSWGDFNNDGFQDILLSGYTGTVAISKLFLNNRDYTFSENTAVTLTGYYQSASAVLDFNNDDYLDFVIAGRVGTSQTTAVYKNNGNGTFTLNSNLAGVRNCSIACTDFNGDGYTDIAFCGAKGYQGNTKSISVYKNNGNNTFTELTGQPFTPVEYGCVSWGDADNDGRPDLLLTGLNSSYVDVSTLYHNNGNNNFNVQTGAVFTGASYSRNAFADFNNDGKLEVIITGNLNTTENYTKIYNNYSIISNAVPSTPDSLEALITSGCVNVSWNKSSDDYTSQNSLTYNVILGSSSGSIDLQSPCSEIPGGFRRIVSDGNAANNNAAKIQSLPMGTYYWSVQAIDNGYKGSPFSVTDTFTVDIPPIQAHHVNISLLTTTQANVKWKRGNGQYCAVFAKKGSYTAQPPVDGIIYNANSDIEIGDSVGNSGWHCIYNGTDTTVTITNLEADSIYWFKVFEYAINPGGPRYNINDAVENPITFHNPIFTEMTVTGIPLLYYGKMDWGDYDNDGDLDLSLFGTLPNDTAFSGVFRNDGNGVFTQATVALPGISSGDILWVDYNNDNFLDIVLTGDQNYQGITKLYTNNTDGTFTENTQNNFQQDHYSRLAVADFNRDGLTDILITGNTTSRLYRNDGGNSFSLMTGISFGGLNNGSQIWEDYNNDGYPDLLLSGSNSTRLYKNNGDNTFTSQNLFSANFAYCGADWGDYNNDGWPDLLISGTVDPFDYSRLYKNNGNGTFSSVSNFDLGRTFFIPIIKWGDYNNDGYPDILITEAGPSNAYVYKNNKDGSFSLQEGTVFPATYTGDVQWVDINNDGKLDIAMTSRTTGSAFSIFINNSQLSNTVPNAPGNLISSIIQDSNITLSWDTASDAETPAPGLSYNLYVRNSLNTTTLISPQSDPGNGWRRVIRRGNLFQCDSLQLNLNDLQCGQYFWSVQAIDASLAGGPFAAVQTFTIPGPDIQANNINFSNIDQHSFSVNWQRGNGDSCVVFMREQYPGIPIPLNDHTYIGDTIFGHGTQIDTSGWFCVYNGTENHVNISGLNANTVYHVMVDEYLGTTGNEIYNHFAAFKNPEVDSTSILFPYDSAFTICKTSSGNITPGDYDRDGHMDLLQVGDTSDYFTLLYKNIGDSIFSVQTNAVNADGIADGMGKWDDYNNDGNIDFLTTGALESDYGLTKIYSNNGNGHFSPVYSGPSVKFSHVDWGDFNNDGLSDFFICGLSNNSFDYSLLYKNNGDSTFTQQAGTSFPNLANGNIEWADFNRDGLLDLMYCGSGFIRIYTNNGDSTFTVFTNHSIPGIYYGFATWGDYNNDGYPDILVSGKNGTLNITKLFKNNNGNSFQEVTGFNATGMQYCSGKWGDIDNDGLLDFVINGQVATDNYQCEIYINNGNDSFSHLIGTVFTGSNGSGTALADFNHDGLLDIALTGYTNNYTRSSGIYINNLNNVVPNTKPAAPTNLNAIVNQDNVTFSWDKSTDAQTPQNGLTYNIAIGTTPGDLSIVSPMSSLADGYRYVVDNGNTGYNNTWKIKKLTPGTYYWTVQSIDNGYLGSDFAPIQQFAVVDTSIQSKDISVNNIQTDRAKIHWVRGNADSCIVLMKKTNSGTAIPADQQFYLADSIFGNGSQIGSSGWFAIYKGTGTQTTVMGLEIATTYRIMICEFSNTAGYVYNRDTANNNPVNFTTTEQFILDSNLNIQGITNSSISWCDYNFDGLLDIYIGGTNNSGNTVSSLLLNNGDSTFTVQSSLIFSSLYNPVVSWGDFNNDNNPDILLTGGDTLGMSHFASLYQNNGNNTFSVQSAPFIAVSSSSSDWGDLNNDGFLDIAITGEESPGNEYCRIYLNNGNGSFTELANAIPVGVSSGSVLWFDYNNDGYNDLFLSGYNSISGTLGKLYKNNGNNTFTEETASVIEGLSHGDAAWGDYNSDGFPDLIISGRDFYYQPKTVLYRNNGDNTFTALPSGLFADLYFSSNAWGDYDNDGDLDIILTGIEGITPICKLYRNEGNNSFALQSGTNFTGIAYGDAAWGDYNNDNKLDLFIAGFNGSISVAKLYTNNCDIANTPPVAPANLQCINTSKNNSLTFLWDAASDNETPQSALTYNLVISDLPAGCNRLSPMSDRANGFRKIVQSGNAHYSTSIIIDDLPAGQLYWSVQTIDNSFKGSPFAIEQSFLTTNEGNESDSLFFSIFPNPSKGLVNITSNSKTPINIIVMDVLGREMLNLTSNEHITSIYLANYSCGIAIIRIFNQDISATFRVIIEK